MATEQAGVERGCCAVLCGAVRLVCCAGWCAVRKTHTLTRVFPPFLSRPSAHLHRYLASLYWTIATMMAVGYGDVYAQTNAEKIYSVLAQTVGAVMFGLIIGTVSSLLEAADARGAAYKRKMNELTGYVRHRGLPKLLVKKIKAHFEYALLTRSVFEENMIFDELSSTLRNDVCALAYQDLIAALHIFADRDRSFVTAIIRSLEVMAAQPGMVLARQGDRADEMYFVVKGTVEAFLVNPGWTRGANGAPKPPGHGVSSAKSLQLGGDGLPLGPVIPGALEDPVAADVGSLAAMESGLATAELAATQPSAKDSATHAPPPDASSGASGGDGGDGGSKSQSKDQGDTGVASPQGSDSFVTKAWLRDPEFQAQPMVILGAFTGGSHFGDGSIRSESQYVCSVRSVALCDICFMHASNLERVCASFPDLAVELAAESTARMAHIEEVAMKLSTRPNEALPDETPFVLNGNIVTRGDVRKLQIWPLRVKRTDEPNTYRVLRKSPDQPGVNPRKVNSRLSAMSFAVNAIKGERRNSSHRAMDVLTKMKRANKKKMIIRSKSGRLTPTTGGNKAANAAQIAEGGIALEINDTTIADLARSQWLIHPEYKRKVTWDLMIACFILYSVLTIPYYISFDVTATGFWNILDNIIDICFALDMIFCFRMVFYDQENRYFNAMPGTIATNYLKSWFIVDFCSTVPIDKIAIIFVGDGGGGAAGAGLQAQLRSLKIIRILRLIRLLKLVRLLKLGKTSKVLEEKITINPALLKLFALLFQVTFIAHILACFWYYVSGHSDQSEEASRSNWVKAIDMTCRIGEARTPEEAVLVTECHESLYLTSIYWAFTTMTTVGYGDVTPGKKAEKATCASDACNEPTALRERTTTSVLRSHPVTHPRPPRVSSGPPLHVCDSEVEKLIHDETFDDFLVHMYVHVARVRAPTLLCVRFYTHTHTHTRTRLILPPLPPATPFVSLFLRASSPVTNAELVYASISMILGATVFGFVVGSVAALMNNFDIGAALSKDKVNHIKNYMRERRLPKALKQSINRFYDFFLLRKSVFDEDVILSALPRHIRQSVLMHVNGDVVSKISFFDGMDPHFVSFVISQMKPQAFSPNQWICLEGEVGMEMFFLLDGTVQCVIGHNSDREKTIKEFSSGMHFGE